MLLVNCTYTVQGQDLAPVGLGLAWPDPIRARVKPDFWHLGPTWPNLTLSETLVGQHHAIIFKFTTQVHTRVNHLVSYPILSLKDITFMLFFCYNYRNIDTTKILHATHLCKDSWFPPLPGYQHCAFHESMLTWWCGDHGMVVIDIVWCVVVQSWCRFDVTM